MLGVVFAAGFAFEVYGAPSLENLYSGMTKLTFYRSGFNNGVNKWWDNHNRGVSCSKWLPLGLGLQLG